MPEAPSFRDLLISIRPELEERGGQVHGATIGLLLRKKEPSFHPSHFGATKLRDLLQRCQDIGHVKRDPQSDDILFVLVDQLQSSPRQKNPERLRYELWNAIVTSPPKYVAILDLSSGKCRFRLQTEDAFEASDPVRFFPIEPIKKEKIISWANEFATTRNIEINTEPLAEETWFSALLNLFPSSLRYHWKQELKVYVIEWWRELAKRHGIRPEQGLKQSPAPKSAIHRQKKPHLERARELVHRAVDQMSLEELSALPIPLKYLL